MDYISSISSLLASLFILLMIIFVVIKGWRLQIVRFYAYFCSGALAILFTMFLSYTFTDYIDLTKMNKLTQMATVVFFSLSVPMALVFPYREKKLSFLKTVLIILPGFIVGGTIVSTDLTISSAYFENGVIIRDTKPFYYFYVAVVFIYFVTSTSIYVIKYIKETVEIYRLQIRYHFLGGSLSLFIALFTSIILPHAFGISQFYVLGPALASFFFTYSLFYGVVAYNLMDMKTAFHKTAMYSIISMVIVLPIFGIIYFAGSNILFFKNLPYFINAAIIVVLYMLFSYFVQPVIDRLFKRKQYAFENIVDNFIRDIEEVKDLDSVIKLTVDILKESLYLRHVFFIMHNDENRRYEITYQNKGIEDINIEPVDRSSALIRWFVKNQDFLYISRVYTDDINFADIRNDIVQFYDNYKLQLILPIYHERRVLGLICLGDKDSFSGFSPEELETLSYFQSKSNDFISTALTYQKAMKEQFISRTIDLSDSLLANSIPDSLPNLKNITFGAFIIPKYEEGTDYFDFIRPGNQGVGVFASDIAGVGINSALYAVILRSAFQACINESPSTYMVMQKINNVLHDYTRGKGGFITAFYFYYDIKSNKLMYTNAGYPALEVFRVEKNNFDSLDTEGIPLGYDKTTSYGIGRTNLLKGDIGILYSKTLISSKNHKGEEFTLLKLRGIVSNNRMRHPSDIAEVIKSEYEKFMGISSPASDVFVLLFKII